MLRLQRSLAWRTLLQLSDFFRCEMDRSTQWGGGDTGDDWHCVPALPAVVALKKVKTKKLREISGQIPQVWLQSFTRGRSDILKNTAPLILWLSPPAPPHTRSCIRVGHVGSCSCILTQRGFVQSGAALWPVGTDVKIYRMTQCGSVCPVCAAPIVQYLLFCPVGHSFVGLDLHVILKGEDVL